MGELLTEVCRAGMHGMSPSALLSRVMEGVRKYREQVGDDDLEDRRVMAHLEHLLLQARTSLKDLEDVTYSRV